MLHPYKHTTEYISKRASQQAGGGGLWNAKKNSCLLKYLNKSTERHPRLPYYSPPFFPPLQPAILSELITWARKWPREYGQGCTESCTVRFSALKEASLCLVCLCVPGVSIVVCLVVHFSCLTAFSRWAGGVLSTDGIPGRCVPDSSTEPGCGNDPKEELPLWLRQRGGQGQVLLHGRVGFIHWNSLVDWTKTHHVMVTIWPTDSD